MPSKAKKSKKNIQNQTLDELLYLKSDLENRILSLKLLNEKIIRQIQMTCPHIFHEDPCKRDLDIRFVPDPSGNNDSYFECLTCHKTMKRLPK